MYVLACLLPVAACLLVLCLYCWYMPWHGDPPPTHTTCPPMHPQLEAVVRRLLWLTRLDRTTRVLVFSTWKDVLELIRYDALVKGQV